MSLTGIMRTCLVLPFLVSVCVINSAPCDLLPESTENDFFSPRFLTLYVSCDPLRLVIMSLVFKSEKHEQYIMSNFINS